MVVFDSVTARLSAELCLAIPGDLDSKVVYLHKELKSQYPQVDITHSNTDSSIKIQGHLKEIVDLHSILDLWFRTRDQTKQNDIADNLNSGLETSSTCSIGLSASLPSISQPLETPNPLPVSTATAYDIQYLASTAESNIRMDQLSAPMVMSTAVADNLRNNGALVTVAKPAQSRPTAPQLLENNMINQHAAAVPASGESMSVTGVVETEATVNALPALSTADPEVSSEVGKESHNIKSVIESWSNRKKNQEVQTDLSELAPSPQSSGRRRKPGTPRKAKAHIPLKTEQPVQQVISTRSRKKPARYADDEKPKRKIGRPQKEVPMDRVLPEEMIPLPSKLQIYIEEEKPSYDLVDSLLHSKNDKDMDWTTQELLTEDREEEEETGFDNLEVNEMSDTGVDPFDLDNSVSREGKNEVKRAGKVCEAGEELEVLEERRGRKHKDGPYVSREVIDRILPHDEVTNVRCTLCEQVCKSRASLKQHYIRCHLERRFQCMVCRKRYGMLKDLARHKLTHNRRHQCSVCDKKFATQILLEGHVDRKHTNPKVKEPMVDKKDTTRITCVHCKFTAKSKKTLKDHIRRKHGAKNIQCPVCDKVFALTKDLNQHVKFHTDVYQCEECGKALKSTLALKLHISVIHRGVKRTSEKQYVCDECGKICRNKTHFKEHMNKVHLGVKPFKCETCSSAFYSQHALRCHSFTHSESREFICDVCAKAFKSRSGLRVHRITHREVAARPYVCATCSKTFTQRGALVRHERIHSGDRPYSCQLCDAAFTDYSILRRHVVGVHKIDDRALCGRGNMDPTSNNRGRPKVAGPTHSVTMLPDPGFEQSIIVESTSEQVQILPKANVHESSDGSIAQTLAATTDAHFTLVEPAQRLYQLSTPVDDHSYGISTPKLLRDHTVVNSSISVNTSHIQVDESANAHPGQQQQVQEQQSIELIQLANLSPSQIMQQHQQIHVRHNNHHHHQQQQQQQQQQQHQLHHQQQHHHAMSIVPVSVVNDLVHNTMYEQHLQQQEPVGGGGGSYTTIGMPVFPTPTTVGSMHVMQPVQPIVHVQQQQQQQQQHQHQQHHHHQQQHHINHGHTQQQ